MTRRPISRLLVANRAEIASRVFRTCRRLGIETVAVCSDADAGLPYVREADAVVPLPGDSPADTYLRTDLILDAARRAGADAVHPGYGFLSESADFARAVIGAGLTWVGPPPDAIDRMGSKIGAKELMRAAGVPVLEAPEHPTEADLPLIVKASAGGGGRGMRIVRRLEDLAGEIEAAQAEAASAFGDGTVFVEPYVERGRHVEVQVVFDSHGRGVTVGDRDCSVQRRHQKVVEEAPAPGLPESVRAAMASAALRAGTSVAYAGAGTVEFLYDPARESFFFLEMNTRLQVEHPVTELVHGIDLVEWQLAVAEGADLPEWDGRDGHAIEVRLYAEDPAAEHQPQSGSLTRFDIPLEDGIRVDAGYETGSTVSTFYDAMLAKVVCHAPTREQAARQLSGVLSRSRIHGVRTNRDQLIAVLRHDAFLSGDVSTAFLTDHPSVDPSPVERSSVERSRSADSRGDRRDHAPTAAALALAEQARWTRTVQQGVPVAWRNVTSQPQRTLFEVSAGSTTETVAWFGTRDGYLVEGVEVLDVSRRSSGRALPVRGETVETEWAVLLESDGVRTTYEVEVHGDRVEVDWPGGHAALTRTPRFTDPKDAVASGSLLAPMPGTVVRVAVESGQQVAAGDVVLVLEAMKMQHTVSAPHAGTVTQIDVRPGTQVAAGEVLAVVEPGG